MENKMKQGAVMLMNNKREELVGYNYDMCVIMGKIVKRKKWAGHNDNQYY